LRGVGVSLGNYLRTIDLPYQHLRAECHDITPISGLNTHRTLFSPQHIGYQVRGSNADQMESHSFPRKASSWSVYLESEHVDKHKRLLCFEWDLPGASNIDTAFASTNRLVTQEAERTMITNEEPPVKDMERGSEYVEEKPHYADINKDDVGYKEYLESLDVEFSPREERWVRWKLDVCTHALQGRR
jgi:hypothetical protein